MRALGTLVVVLATTLLLVGCSKGDDNSGDGAKTKATIPDQPAGLDGKEFCAKVPKDVITAAIEAPYRTYDAIPLKDFPVPGVTGYECQWEWQNPAGDVRNLKIDAISFDGSLDGSLDASWKGTVDLLGTQGEPVDGVGEEAVSAKLQGLVTLSARKGQWQVTAVSSSKGAVPPASVDTLARVANTVLKVAD